MSLKPAFEPEGDEIVDGVDVVETPAAGPEATPAQIAALKNEQTLEFDDSSYDESPATPAPVTAPTEPVAETKPEEIQQAEEEIPAATPAVPKGSQKTEPVVEDENETTPAEVAPIFEQTFLDAAGINADQAKSQFGTPQALENAVRMLDQRFLAAGERVLSQQAQAPTPATTQQPTQQSATGDAKPAAPAATFKLPPPADGEEWDEDTQKVAASIAQHFQAQLDAQRQQANELLGQQQAVIQQILEERIRQEQIAYANEFDGVIEKLGTQDEQWKQLLGEGSGFDLPKESIAYLNRVHLDTIANQLKAGLESQGKTVINREQLLVRALPFAFPEQQKIAVKKEVTKEILKRQSMQTARPTAKAPPGKTGTDRAAATSDQWYKNHGFAVEEDVFDYETI